MKQQEQANTPADFFGQQQAASYDKRWEEMAPIRDALHLSLRSRLAELPDDAHILCVGAGTGAEVLYLAKEFPDWSFTAVEPSKPMLDICRQKAEAQGIASRCTWHEGYLDSLPPASPFDAATCILVSQFLTDPEERRNFFVQIHDRLRSGGYLISADLSTGTSASSYEDLLGVWLQLQKLTGVPEEMLQQMISAYNRHVAISSPQDLEELIASAGFEAPILFFQALLIHAWYARRPL